MKTEMARETRERLLDAAEKVFSQKGYAATKLEDIAIASGHTRGAISFHFKNKLSIFKSMLSIKISTALDEEIDILTSQFSPKDRYHLLVNTMISRRQSRSTITKIYNTLLIEEIKGVDSIIEDVENSFRNLFRNHAEMIRDGISLSEFRDDIDPEMEAKASYTWFWGFFTNINRFFLNDNEDAIKSQVKVLFIDRIKK